MEHVRLEPVSAERCVQEADVCVNLSSGGPFRGPRWDQLAGASTAEIIHATVVLSSRLSPSGSVLFLDRYGAQATWHPQMTIPLGGRTK